MSRLTHIATSLPIIANAMAIAPSRARLFHPVLLLFSHGRRVSHKMDDFQSFYDHSANFPSNSMANSPNKQTHKSTTTRAEVPQSFHNFSCV
ncbi:hypothetical protein F5888DRAFT_1677077, partial [Russula emetica]